MAPKKNFANLLITTRPRRSMDTLFHANFHFYCFNKGGGG